MTFKSDSIVYIQQYVHKLFLLNFLLKIFLKKKKKKTFKNSSDVLLTNSMLFSFHSGPA